MYVCLILFLNVFAMIFHCVFSEYYSLCISPCNIESQCMFCWGCFVIMYLWWSSTVYSLCIPLCNIESQCMFPWYCTDPSPGQSLWGNVFVSPFLLPKRNINDNLKPFKHYQKYITFPDQLSDCYQVLTDSVKMSVIFDDMNDQLCFLLLSSPCIYHSIRQPRKCCNWKVSWGNFPVWERFVPWPPRYWWSERKCQRKIWNNFQAFQWSLILAILFLLL